MEEAVAIRDFFGGVASLFLMLAKIILCLTFVFYDSLAERRTRRRSRRSTEDARSAPVLEQG